MTRISRSRPARYKKSGTVGTLREINVTPVKSLGQNFLHDRNLARWIVDQLAAGAGDYVVEIGPGLGALTQYLVETGAQVLALEKDHRLANYLRSRFSADAFEVRHVDALEFNVSSLFTKPIAKLIGNLPYYISSQVLLKFLECPTPISLAVLMLQKEMAARLSAAPGSKDYGALSVLVQRHYKVRLLRTVSRGVFIPRPEVDSAVIRITPLAAAALPDYDDDLLVALVRQGFSQRRKQLGQLLGDYVADWPRAAGTLGLEPTARAEKLSVEQWVALTNYVRPIELPSPAGQEEEMFPVVDQSDRFLYAAPRSKVHGDNLCHRAVHILIFNDAGEVYLQKRSVRKERHPGLWDSSAAGHVGAGEEYDAAARRELQEELGIEVPLEKIGQLPASERTGQEFVWLYRGVYDGRMSLNRAEVETGRYIQPVVVTGWIAARPGDFAPGFPECWNTYLQRSR